MHREGTGRLTLFARQIDRPEKIERTSSLHAIGTHTYGLFNIYPIPRALKFWGLEDQLGKNTTCSGSVLPF